MTGLFFCLFFLYAETVTIRQRPMSFMYIYTHVKRHFDSISSVYKLMLNLLITLIYIFMHSSHQGPYVYTFSFISRYCSFSHTVCITLFPYIFWQKGLIQHFLNGNINTCTHIHIYIYTCNRVRRYASSCGGRGFGEPASEPVFSVVPATHAGKKT